MIAAVILAAGAGERLGGVAKALLVQDDGRTFLAVVSECARAAGVQDCVVVIGPPHHDSVAREAQRLGLTTVINPEPGRGMGSSVELGFAHVLEHLAGASAALLWPVDHARVRPASVRAIVQACGPQHVVIPTYQGHGGHPTAFGRVLWEALSQCSSEPQGARSVVHRLYRTDPGCIQRLEIDDSGVVADVDTPRDR